MNKKYNFTYKTTNLINDKYYYGCHSTDNLMDNYIGSGNLLWRAIEKHGIKNFQCDWIENYSTREEMFQAEKELITEEKIKDRNCYNLKHGGLGGAALGHKVSESTKLKISESHKGRKHTSQSRKNMSEAHKGFKRLKESIDKTAKSNTGKKRTIEQKKRMSEAQKGKVISEKALENIRIAAKRRRGIDFMPKETREKVNKIFSQSQKGRKASLESKNKMAIKRIAGIYFTPLGNFLFLQDACNKMKIPRTTLNRICHNPSNVFSNLAFSKTKNDSLLNNKELIGMTFLEIGFGFCKISKQQKPRELKFDHINIFKSPFGNYNNIDEMSVNTNIDCHNLKIIYNNINKKITNYSCNKESAMSLLKSKIGLTYKEAGFCYE